MPRYIDADALENEVHTICREFIGSCRDFRTKCALYDAMKGVLVRIYDAPTISPDEVRGVGEWLTEYEPNGRPYQFHCSVCDSDFSQMGITHASNYCPSCGAKMEVSEDA